MPGSADTSQVVTVGVLGNGRVWKQMIKVVTKNKALRKSLVRHLAKEAVRYEVIDVQTVNDLDRLYCERTSALVIDVELTNIARPLLADILNSLSNRIPVVAISSAPSTRPVSENTSPHYHETVTVLHHPREEEVFATLSACGAIGPSTAVQERVRMLPFYNPQIALKLLQENGGISVLTIDAGSFRKIELEYGTDVYERIRSVFQSLLCEMWGGAGFFRHSDILCRRSHHSNTFYVFLNRARHHGALPRPGVLEKISDRVNRNLQNALWAEIFKRGSHRRLPACIENVPLVAVGFATALHNPCLDSTEVIEKVLESSVQCARTQNERMYTLQRELMHTLIQTDELLFPNFQAIFKLPGITSEMVSECQENGSIQPLASHLYGFESLIRVRGDLVDSYVGRDQAVVESRYLRPDVLFSMAKATKVALELDQACLRAASRFAHNLPGRLFINILPRNLYFIDRLVPMLPQLKQVTFEVSESEAISNFELMMQVREDLRAKGIGIAADDFGKGFAGLERIIKIKPDVIKFDRSLIENIHQDPLKQAYVRGLVRAAKILQTTVLAEGVEKWEEALVLQQMNIDLVQGYLFHRPQQAEQILNQLPNGQSSQIKSVA